MKLGDMTVRQLAEICEIHNCEHCIFGDGGSLGGKGFDTCLLNHIPCCQNLDMEVNLDAEAEDADNES